MKSILNLSKTKIIEITDNNVARFGSTVEQPNEDFWEKSVRLLLEREKQILINTAIAFQHKHVELSTVYKGVDIDFASLNSEKIKQPFEKDFRKAVKNALGIKINKSMKKQNWKK